MGYNLEEIKNKIRIEDIAEDYGIDLEPSGSDYIALCPFHDDVLTKSLRIYSVTNSWWCYGCQRGGSIFDFVMVAEGIEFVDAIDKLAQKCGLQESFDLSGISVQSSYLFQQFKDLRESIENRITIQMRECYFSQKNVGGLNEKNMYIQYINDLWNWFDKSQRFFDKYLVYREKCIRASIQLNEEELFQFLISKLHSFYLRFVKKFNKLKERKHGKTT